jgi:hypothetical protein
VHHSPLTAENLRAEQKVETKNMKEKPVRLPGPDHPISIERNPARVVVSIAGRVVADSRNALTLREAAYPPVQYIHARMLISRNCSGRITSPTALTKAIATTTAFPPEERNQSMQCGHTRIRCLQPDTSGDMSHSIPNG